MVNKIGRICCVTTRGDSNIKLTLAAKCAFVPAPQRKMVNEREQIKNNDTGD
jgi:hypothetical protein